MAARPGDPGRWMAGAIRCLLVQVERLERQLAYASECSKGEQAPQNPLECISRSAVSVVDTLVSLDRSPPGGGREVVGACARGAAGAPDQG